MTPLKIVSYLNHPIEKANGCTLYRQWNPLKYAKGIKVRYIDQVKGEINFNPVKRAVDKIEIDTEPIEWADVVIFQRHYDQVALMGCLMEVAMQMGKTVIYETDDLIQKVNQNIGGFNQDGVDFKKQTRFVEFCLKHCDLITVSTKALAEAYLEYPGDKVVLPNYYDPAQWRGLHTYRQARMWWRRKVKGDKRFRIGWHGGNNHLLNNFNYIVDPLNKLARKYKDKFQFVYMGGHPNMTIYSGKADRRKYLEFDFEYHDPVSVWQFPRAVAEMDLDVAMAVVEDNEFSRAKSNIKWLENSILGVPTIASNCTPYQDTNAVLVENTEEAWISAIEDMMLNPEKRVKLGEEARQMALTYNVKNHASKWATAYREAWQHKMPQQKSVMDEVSDMVGDAHKVGSLFGRGK